MSHSLHRTGSVESLANDYVFISRPAIGVNEEGAGSKMKRMLEIVFDLGPTNIGALWIQKNTLTGMTHQDMIDGMTDRATVFCSMANRDKLKEALALMKEEDLGISITISGLIDDLVNLASELGLQPHSVNLSLGVHGKTELLPAQEVMELTTMCGHGLIAGGLAAEALQAVRAGDMTACQAARTVGTPCICGIFNLERAEALLTEATTEHKS